MPNTSKISARPPESHAPAVTAAPFAPGGGTTAMQTVNDITFAVTTINNGPTVFDIAQVLPQGVRKWTLSSETPAVCSISGDQVLKVSSGIGIIRATGPNGFSRKISVDLTATTTTSVVWTGITAADTKTKKLSDPILNLLIASKQKNYYPAPWPLASTPAAGSSFPRNPNCWAASIDLSASPITTGLGGNVYAHNSGALITPRHWVGVAHWGSGNTNMGPGQELRFVGSDGLVYVRTVLQRDYQTVTADRIVCLLNADLPPSVTPFKLAGASMRDAATNRFYGMGWQILQDKNVSPVGFDSFMLPFYPMNSPNSIGWQYNWINMTDPTHRLYGLGSLLQNARGGDSGGAVGGYYNGQSYLVSLFGGLGFGELYSELRAAELNSIIANLDAAQGINTGYQVQVLNVP